MLMYNCNHSDEIYQSVMRSSLAYKREIAKANTSCMSASYPSTVITKSIAKLFFSCIIYAVIGGIFGVIIGYAIQLIFDMHTTILQTIFEIVFIAWGINKGYQE